MPGNGRQSTQGVKELNRYCIEQGSPHFHHSIIPQEPCLILFFIHEIS